jgi:hypothetical protein
MAATKQAVTHIWESRRSNRYKPCRETWINTTCTLHMLVHVRLTYASCEQSPYVATFHTDPTELDRFTAPEKNCSWLHSQLGWVVCRSCISLSPNPAIEAVHLSQAFVEDMLYWFTVPINTSMRLVRSILAHGGPTHRSLTDTGGGYSLEGAGLPQTTLRPSQPMTSTFHLRAPPDLQFNQVLPTKSCLSLRNLWPITWSSDHSAIYRDRHLCLPKAIDLSIAIGFIRIDWKVVLI